MIFRFTHPLDAGRTLEAELPAETTFGEMARILCERGFLAPKRGGWQFIVDDRLCSSGRTVRDYVSEPMPERLDVRVHGLLTVLI